MSQDKQRHPWVELLMHYRSIFSAAWLERQRLDGPIRTADELAFLPAALSLQESPVHPMPRRFAWVLMALFVMALLWSFLGRLDIVAVTTGRIVVSDRTKVIQPLEASVVRRILVKDGDRVHSGQVLVELDPTMAEADLSSVHEQFLATTSDEIRSTALLKSFNGSSPTLPAILPKGLSAAQVNQQLQVEWQDIFSKRSKFEAEIKRKQAELATAREWVKKVDAMLPLSRQREVDYQTLVEQGFISNHATQDRARERIELERDLSAQHAKVVEAQAGLAESKLALSAYLAEVHRTLQDRQFVSNTKRTQLQAEVAKAAQREKLTLLKSPANGVVQQLVVHSVGGVVTSAQPLMVIVPDANEVTALVQVANLDIGFVQQGQQAEIKLETFPYTKYGTIPARITVLGNDAVTDEKTGQSTYPALLTLEHRYIQVEGKSVPVSPGMNVTAEIKTGERRIIEYLLSPIIKAGSESLRER